MNDIGNHPDSSRRFPGGGASGGAYFKDVVTHVRGLVLAAILTAVPFGLVHAHAMPTASLWIAIGLLAVVQAVVHFRCFLDIRLSHKNVDTILLVLFTALILVIMVGGTVWVLGNLHARMMI